MVAAEKVLLVGWLLGNDLGGLDVQGDESVGDLYLVSELHPYDVGQPPALIPVWMPKAMRMVPTVYENGLRASIARRSFASTSARDSGFSSPAASIRCAS